MTIHAAKGLEFPIVFLMGLNEGILPSRKTKTRAAMEEERRLAFVAMTRAKDRLYLSEAEGLGIDGYVRFPSRFLLDVDKSLLDFHPQPNAALMEEARAESPPRTRASPRPSPKRFPWAIRFGMPLSATVQCSPSKTTPPRCNSTS